MRFPLATSALFILGSLLTTGCTQEDVATPRAEDPIQGTWDFTYGEISAGAGMYPIGVDSARPERLEITRDLYRLYQGEELIREDEYALRDSLDFGGEQPEARPWLELRPRALAPGEQEVYYVRYTLVPDTLTLYPMCVDGCFSVYTRSPSPN